jgi:hypothetical protein
MLFKRGYINKIKKRNDINLNININNNFKKNFNLKNRKEIILKKTILTRSSKSGQLTWPILLGLVHLGLYFFIAIVICPNFLKKK